MNTPRLRQEIGYVRVGQCGAPNSSGYCQLTYPCAFGRCQYDENNQAKAVTTNNTGHSMGCQCTLCWERASKP